MSIHFPFQSDWEFCVTLNVNVTYANSQYIAKYNTGKKVK